LEKKKNEPEKKKDLGKKIETGKKNEPEKKKELDKKVKGSSQEEKESSESVPSSRRRASENEMGKPKKKTFFVVRYLNYEIKKTPRKKINNYKHWPMN